MRKRGTSCLSRIGSRKSILCLSHLRSKKRGQLTIFIIVAVVVVLLIGFYSMFKSNFFNQKIDGSDAISNDIIECMNLNTKNALYFVSYQGGFNNPPEKSFSFNPTFFPYYYYEGKSYMPSIEMIEEEMGEFVEENLPKCISQIEARGFEVSYSEPNVKVDISKEGVEYIVDMPVTLIKEDMSMTIQLSRFPIFYETRLYDMYVASKFFVEDQLEDPEYYCISCISEMASKGEFKFYLFNLMPDVYLVMAFENKDNPVVFNFVNKYESTE